ncbi:Hypothetical protein NTJ_02964 [Nesidiocoris tenuis]|uniref:Uncharacterized protein n=1 Tax=Nesidiocoris tenuis TaxID=355587 RepID=A0ABN7ACY3_9HEMI|nr:Hypothetical protein NTJ_02964 [Nesidiocoris tenuis]
MIYDRYQSKIESPCLFSVLFYLVVLSVPLLPGLDWPLYHLWHSPVSCSRFRIWVRAPSVASASPSEDFPHVSFLVRHRR